MTMHQRISSVCVVGLGYIGLPTAALIASRGLKVIGVDTNPVVVETVGRGNIHIAEADLDGLVQKGVMTGCLVSRDKPEQADVFIIAVPTPLSGNKKPVVDHVLAAARSIAPCLSRGSLVIIESTLAPSSMDSIVAPLFASYGLEDGRDITLGNSPNRVMPGRLVERVASADKIVGALRPETAARIVAER